ncbi:hypothetical protein EK21DRAFT_91793 [Setomelanomma holmii]|uniref:Uncharacterized protein n=1 Tax=Setomelanomma holmii TaxID=210430 RepID=A0A9P4LJ17_9PLEO|nr:hypothetical protein EK21DRAFT_91793 [Setomelanomma holmii]
MGDTGTSLPPQRPYVSRIQVVNATPHKILVANTHDGLREDLNWARHRKAETADLQKAVVYEFGQSQSERAFAFSSSDKQWNLDVEVQLGAGYDGMTVQLYLDDQDTYISRANISTCPTAFSNHVVVSGNSAVFRFEGNGDAPYGWFGKYRITVHIWNAPFKRASNPEENAKVPDFHLEAYYLSTSNLPEYFKDGIPLLLLRMFVLPWHGRLTYDSIEAYIEHVTQVVFGSRKPYDGRPSATSDHWLVYNSDGGGSASFASQYGEAGLNLTAWLDAFRNFEQHGLHTHVNCYDQAAITEIALCLGLSHNQIHWEYNQVYGFIDAELVGWGRVNSPYFDDIKDTRFYKQVDGKEDSRRQPFNNHAYLSWSKEPVALDFYKQYDEAMKDCEDHDDYAQRAENFEKTKGVTLRMIDSCAGPHPGTETRQETI